MNSKNNKIYFLIAGFFLIVAVLLFQFSNKDKYDTQELLTKQETLNKDQMNELSKKTLIVCSNKFDEKDTNAINIEKSNNIYTLTYEKTSDAEKEYKKYSKDKNVIFCEYDSVLETASTKNEKESTDEKNDEVSKETKEKVYDTLLNDTEIKIDHSKANIVVIDSGATGKYEHSYNVFDGSSDVTDKVGHGTKMIEYIENELEGYNYEIIPIKIANSNGLTSVSALIKALDYATTLNPTVVNMSLTSTNTNASTILEEYITKLGNIGAVSIISAGNEGDNVKNYVPANIDPAIVVGSCDKNGKRKDFSNYGDTVDYLVTSNSTSQAAAITSGLYAKAFLDNVSPQSVMYESGKVFDALESTNLEMDAKRDYNVTDERMWWCYAWSVADSGTNSAPVIDEGYYFAPKWVNGKSKLVALSSTPSGYSWQLDGSASASDTLYHLSRSNGNAENPSIGNNWKGYIWAKYENIGTYYGQAIDGKITFTDWGNPFGLRFYLNSFGFGNASGAKNDGRFIRAKIEFYIHGTNFTNPINIKGHMHVNDMDYFARNGTGESLRFFTSTTQIKVLIPQKYRNNLSVTNAGSNEIRTIAGGGDGASDGSNFAYEFNGNNQDIVWYGGMLNLSIACPIQEFEIHYHQKTGTGNEDDAIMSPTRVNYDVKTYYSKNKFECPKAEGYHFNGWHVQADYEGKWLTTDGSTTYTEPPCSKASHYADADWVARTNVCGTVNFYACWKPNTYNIVYDGNGNTGGSMATDVQTYDTAKALTKNSFTKDGYEFVEWNTEADGSGTSYTDGQLIENLTSENNATITLYAQWKKMVVTYHGNGGLYNGSDIYQETDISSDYIIKPNNNANLFKKTGYKFTYWTTTPDEISDALDENGTAFTLKGTYLKGLFIVPHENYVEVYVKADGSIKNVQLPTWTAYNGQDDLTWHTTKSGSYKINNDTYQFYGVIYIKDHKNERFNYTTHVYGSQTAGSTTWKEAVNMGDYTYSLPYGLSKLDKSKTDIIDKNGKVYDINGTYIQKSLIKEQSNSTYDIYVNAVNCSYVWLPTWTWTNGQDVLVWHGTTKGSWTIDGNDYNFHTTISLSNHKMEREEYATHIYASDSFAHASNKECKTNMSNYSFDGDPVTLTKSPDYYAHWKPITYTIKYDGNGATSGIMKDSSHTYDTVKKLRKNAYIKDEIKFSGWNTKVDGTGKWYKDEAEVNNLTTKDGEIITLYAQWDDHLRASGTDIAIMQKDGKDMIKKGTLEEFITKEIRLKISNKKNTKETITNTKITNLDEIEEMIKTIDDTNKCEIKVDLTFSNGETTTKLDEPIYITIKTLVLGDDVAGAHNNGRLRYIMEEDTVHNNSSWHTDNEKSSLLKDTLDKIKKLF